PIRRVRQVAARRNYFAWIKRRIGDAEASKIESLKLSGLYIVSEPARFYPNGSTAANLIGGVGLDNRGLFGIERHFEKELAGNPALIRPAKDAKGRSIYFQADAAAPEQPGNNVILTI